MHGMVAAGADIIELGVPFSDPMADGPVIQKAGEKALALGVGMRQVFQMVRQFRQRDGKTPVVLMGYANPVERYNLTHGKEAFIRDAAAAGVDGVLIVDYPPEECEDFSAQLKAHGLDLIFLLAPTSTEERMQQVARVASGYVYYVSLKGVTGAGHLDTGAVELMLPRIRRHVHIPVGVGFGIRDAATAAAIGKVADAVVIGTKIIQLIEDRRNHRSGGRAGAGRVHAAATGADRGPAAQRGRPGGLGIPARDPPGAGRIIAGSGSSSGRQGCRGCPTLGAKPK